MDTQHLTEQQLIETCEFHEYGRYATIRAVIEAQRKKGDRFRVLDVGGRGNMLRNFLPRDAVFYLDPFVDTEDDNYIEGDGCLIPLPDASFDWVVSADTFEHIPPKKRKDFLRENLRVATLGVVLVAPFFTPDVALAEKNANENYRRMTGKEHPWLQEHIVNGLPHSDEVTEYVNNSGYTAQQFGNNRLDLWSLLIGLNLFAGENLHPGVAQALRDCNRLYNTTIYPADSQEPTYRKIFFIKKNPSLQDVALPVSRLEFTTRLALIKQYVALISQVSASQKTLHEQEKKTFALYSERATRLFEEIAKKDADIHHLQDALQTEHAALQHSQQEARVKVQQKDADIQHLQESLSKLQTHITAQTQEFTSHIQTKDSAIQQLQQTIQAVEKNLSESRQTLELQDQSIRKLQHALQEQEHALQEREQVLQAEILSLRNTIAWMESSLFWKLRLRYIALQQFSPRTLLEVGGKGVGVLWRDGVVAFGKACMQYVTHGRSSFQKQSVSVTQELNPYELWIQQNERTAEKMPTQTDEHALPIITFITTLSVSQDPSGIANTYASLCMQTSDRWEWVLSVRGQSQQMPPKLEQQLRKDSRVKIKKYLSKKETLSAWYTRLLASVRGESAALLHAGDTASPFTTAVLAHALQQHPHAQLLYSDKDHLRADGKRFNPFFKPEWAPDTLLSINAIGHLAAYRTQMLKSVILDPEVKYEEMLEYDIALKVTERLDPQQIVHIPTVLYHRLDPTSEEHEPRPELDREQLHVIQSALNRRGIGATAVSTGVRGVSRVQRVIHGTPLVSISIPFRDQADVLQRCIESIRAKSTYSRIELLLINNQSAEQRTHDYLASLQGIDTIRIINHDKPFNYSEINNQGARVARGKYLLFLNNDTEVIEPGWIEALLEHAQRDEVGVVGAKLLFPNNTVQHAGVVLGIGGIAGHAMKYMPRESRGYHGLLQTIRNCSAVTGACMMMRASVFHELNGFDAVHLPVSFNDVDMCLRARSKGYLVIYTPYAELYHYESLTRGSDEERKNTHPTERARVQSERAYMLKRWGVVLEHDPYYSPHLSRVREDYSIRI